MPRTKIPQRIRLQVLTEAGYRCAVPTCRTILALDLHHLVEVSEGGTNDPTNLLPLCPTCHALHHRGEIKRDSLYTWKSIIVSLSQAFDQRDIDDLLFLGIVDRPDLQVSGDGVLKFSRLIASGLAAYGLAQQGMGVAFYRVSLTEKGRYLVDAWKSGNREAATRALV